MRRGARSERRAGRLARRPRGGARHRAGLPRRAGLRVLIAAPLLAATAVPAQSPAGPGGAVRYVERPVGGPRAEEGIELGPAGSGPYIIDRLSRVLIDVDRRELAEALVDRGILTPRRPPADLAARARLLETAATLMREATEGALRAFRAGTVEEARREIAAMGRTNARVLRALREARRERLLRELGSESAAEEAAERAVAAVLSDRPPGYDWDRLAALAAEELARLYDDLLVFGLGVELEIQAHAIAPDGTAHPMFLEGYNQVVPGPLRPVSKVRFAVPDEVARAIERTGAIAREIDSASSLWRAFREQVRAELAEQRPVLLDLLLGVRAARERTVAELRALSEWILALSPERLPATLRDELRELPGYDDLERIVRETREDLDLLAALGDLGDRLSALPPDRALAELLAALGRLSGPDRYRALHADVWRERARAVRTFLDALPEALRARLEERSIRFAEASARARDALAALGEAIAGLPERAVPYLLRATGLATYPSPEILPLPAGQLRRPITADLDTSFDLRRLPRSVQDADQVIVSFRLYENGIPLAEASWRDTFETRAFGLSSRVVASLAFARRGVAGATWEPAPAASFVLHWKRWPRNAAEARRSRRWQAAGIGLSALSLDFQDGQDVELGLAATLSLLDDRLLAGYGVNLQADRDGRFWFASIRLFRFGDPLR